MQDIYIVKLNGERELFDITKLKNSLRRAGADEKSIQEISLKIVEELKDGTTTTKIYKKAFSFLRKKDKVIAGKYSVRRAIEGLGPHGFPFEDFIGEIFRAKGYDVEVGQTVNGKCVMHEMDVVAHNEKEIIVGEIKFHNDTALKSDLKVALYVKARLDDIKEGDFYQRFGEGKEIKHYLITNTKFSGRAIQYGNCAGLNLIGWNYPSQGNLQDLVEETKVHPLTCLVSLTKKEKQEFLNQGIVLCKDIIGGGENILGTVGISGQRVEKVLAEAKNICK
ncbi:TPA: hypothetical protein DCZ46_00200 [Candidatus Campbellbacteria bacterium]|nr:MAG: ATP-cone domain-containing protein [Candidatus Campbellbacteria bacterium GW2011_OD1_34_28]KKP74608.1 MAG: ATP-cone domain protein [Candidatus Campbellbacteria bacterium GW2011_GWD2_35_24]KKP76740.1 MAG: ATP-cone domain protein [Candidatus Campbellbacteria bacterium GW2011_GWC1_35_31]KKP78689.1 MAG: ATP-cone domain protein [Candidatus Campbellbacteria bacterium GW2011_GWD1_35_49]HAP74370.1 hypothetical protein [Candidatus Campbellbacteria bacterium]